MWRNLGGSDTRDSESLIKVIIETEMDAKAKKAKKQKKEGAI